MGIGGFIAFVYAHDHRPSPKDDPMAAVQALSGSAYNWLRHIGVVLILAGVMTILATTHSHSLGWGVALVVVGVLHLAFRGFYARRSAAVETARQETAPGPLRGRGLYVTGRRANMIWIVGSSVVFIIVGLVLIATQS